jgi:CBS domain-containing protein
MAARDVMTTKVVTAKADLNVVDVAALMLERHISAVPVVDDANRVIGLISEGDLMRRPETGTERHASWWLHAFRSPRERAEEFVKSHGSHASDVMTKTVISVGEDASLSEIAQILEERRIKRVPVVRDGVLVGIVSRADLLRGLVSGKAHPDYTASHDDNEMRKQIMATVESLNLASPALVNVIVTDGVAHIWGMVESRPERDAIRIAAENAEGVTRVEDHLGVLPQALGWP